MPLIGALFRYSRQADQMMRSLLSIPQRERDQLGLDWLLHDQELEDFIEGLPGGVPSTIVPDAVADAGASRKYAPELHVHGLVADPPVTFGLAPVEGVSTALSRADHIHPFPTAIRGGAVNTAAQNLPTGVETTVAFPGVTGAYFTWDAATNELICGIGADFLLAGRVTAQFTANGQFWARIILNGTGVWDYDQPPPLTGFSAGTPGQASCHMARPRSLAVGDRVKLTAYQATGAAASIITDNSWISVDRISDR